uniref:Transmembrane protein 180-like n=1 Tax=Caenorhabditis tropicalis TaxID=1561998 RepID=A0A1I7TVB5_9PELO
MASFRSLLSYTALLIGLISFSADLINYVFTSKYIQVFFDEYHLPPSYLKVVQILFLVWNAVNDPMMGYMQDLGCCGMKWIMDRRKVVLYAGPVFAASFLLFWFPWSTSIGWVTALHLLVSLFIYDTLLTLVLSAYCGLCVENSRNHEDRVRVIVYGEIFTIIAGLLIFPLETMPHTNEHYWLFQTCCVVIACVSAALMAYSGYNLKVEKPVNEHHQLEKFQEGEENSAVKLKENTWKNALQVSWQISKEPRFICLVGAQFFRILRFMANENFLIVFTESLLVTNGFFEKNSTTLGLFYILARSCGSILFLFLWLPTNRFGTQAVIQSLNILSLFNVAVVLFAGMDNVTAVAIFIILENAISRCGWQGFYIVVAGEVVDTDMKQNNRKSPFSTIIFTLKALFNKPADQLAPVLILSLFLERGGYPQLTVPCQNLYEDNFSNSTILNSTIIETTSISGYPSTQECTNYTHWMFLALAIFPAICAIGESIFVAFDQYWRQHVKGKTGHLGDD